MMNTNISDLSEKDKTWLAISLAKGRELCFSLTGSQQNSVSAEELDKIFMAWASLPEKKRTCNEDAANGLGSLFGELLKTDLGFRWQIVGDRYGTEPALIDEKTGSVVFPINAVWKRIEPTLDTSAFFQPMWEAVKSHVEKAPPMVSDAD